MKLLATAILAYQALWAFGSRLTINDGEVIPLPLATFIVSQPLSVYEAGTFVVAGPVARFGYGSLIFVGNGASFIVLDEADVFGPANIVLFANQPAQLPAQMVLNKGSVIFFEQKSSIVTRMLAPEAYFENHGAFVLREESKLHLGGLMVISENAYAELGKMTSLTVKHVDPKEVPVVNIDVGSRVLLGDAATVTSAGYTWCQGCFFVSYSKEVYLRDALFYNTSVVFFGEGSTVNLNSIVIWAGVSLYVDPGVSIQSGDDAFWSAFGDLGIEGNVYSNGAFSTNGPATLADITIWTNATIAVYGKMQTTLNRVEVGERATFIMSLDDQEVVYVSATGSVKIGADADVVILDPVTVKGRLLVMDGATVAASCGGVQCINVEEGGTLVFHGRYTVSEPIYVGENQIFQFGDDSADTPLPNIEKYKKMASARPTHNLKPIERYQPQPYHTMQADDVSKPKGFKTNNTGLTIDNFNLNDEPFGIKFLRESYVSFDVGAEFVEVKGGFQLGGQDQHNVTFQLAESHMVRILKDSKMLAIGADPHVVINSTVEIAKGSSLIFDGNDQVVFEPVVVPACTVQVED